MDKKIYVCKKCGYAIINNGYTDLVVCPQCGNKDFSTSEFEDKQEIKAENANKPVTCPKCGSTSIQAVQKGFGLLRGFVGSGKTENYCLNCGHKWDPKKQ